MLSGIALLVTGIYHFTRLDVFTLKEVTVSGGETIPHDLVRTRAEMVLDGNYLGLVPKRFVYAYPRESILSQIREIPRVAEVYIKETNEPGLHISIEEYEPAALWCLDSDVTACYFLNADGFSFAEAPVLKGGAFVRHIIEGEEGLRQGQMLESQKFKEIEWFGEMLREELGMRVASVHWRKNRDVELEVGGGGMIFITFNKDIRLTYENLKTVLSSKEYAHLAPGNFKYVDVRFDKKVFVHEGVEQEHEDAPAEEEADPGVE